VDLWGPCSVDTNGTKPGDAAGPGWQTDSVRAIPVGEANPSPSARSTIITLPMPHSSSRSLRSREEGNANQNPNSCQ